ncbi:MAG: hypothetical protein RR068_10425, partial [Hafnia sp.]
MKYSAKVNVKGKTYSIAFTPATGAVYCVNCGTLRTITAAKTLATIYAAWADQDHAEALELNEEMNYHDAIADFSWELQIVGFKETRTAFFAAMNEAL